MRSTRIRIIDVYEFENWISSSLNSPHYLDASLLIIFSTESTEFIEIDYPYCLNFGDVIIFSKFEITLDREEKNTYSITSGIFELSITNEYRNKSKFKGKKIHIYRTSQIPLSSRGLVCNSGFGIKFVQVDEFSSHSELSIVSNFSSEDIFCDSFQLNNAEETKSGKKVSKEKRKSMISLFQNSFRKKE